MILRPAVPADWAAIDSIYRTSFTQTFGHLYEPRDFDLFMARFTPAMWRSELRSSDFAFCLAELDGAPVGYVKVGAMDLPLDEPDDGAVELYHLYLLDAAKGRGIADALLDWAVDEARARGGKRLYLSVFTDNHRAKRFYARHGFTEVGPYRFMVGNHPDEDIIMKRAL